MTTDPAAADAARPAAWVLDVGNTRTAFGWADAAGRILATWRTPTVRELGDRVLTPPWPTPSDPAAVAALSVVAAAASRLDARLRDDGLSPTWWGRTRAIPIPHPYPAGSTPGADRLIACREAFLRAHGAAVVVDAGSALTVDVVSERGEFLGGAIAPGFGALAAGLAAAASSLPPAAAGVPDGFPGRSTDEAVAIGVSAAARGVVRELVLRAEAHLGRRPSLFVTGGDGVLAAAYLADRRPEFAPELVLEGLARLRLEA